MGALSQSYRGLEVYLRLVRVPSSFRGVAPVLEPRCMPGVPPHMICTGTHFLHWFSQHCLQLLVYIVMQGSRTGQGGHRRPRGGLGWPTDWLCEQARDCCERQASAKPGTSNACCRRPRTGGPPCSHRREPRPRPWPPRYRTQWEGRGEGRSRSPRGRPAPQAPGLKAAARAAHLALGSQTPPPHGSPPYRHKAQHHRYDDPQPRPWFPQWTPASPRNGTFGP